MDEYKALKYKNLIIEEESLTKKQKPKKKLYYCELQQQNKCKCSFYI